MASDAARPDAEALVLQLELRITPVDGHVTGRATTVTSTVDFTGWLGLLTAIDALVETGCGS